MTPYNVVSSYLNQIRDESIIAAIEKECSKGNMPFVIFGSGHLIANQQTWAQRLDLEDCVLPLSGYN